MIKVQPLLLKTKHGFNMKSIKKIVLLLPVLSFLSGCSSTDIRCSSLHNTAKPTITDLVTFSLQHKEKNIKKSVLPVSIVIDKVASINPKLKVLCLRVKLHNASQTHILVVTQHEWHGGLWEDTDVYALVHSGSKRDINRFLPVYLAGEMDGKATKMTIMLSGQAVSLLFRMNWSGTGSCPTEPLMSPSKGNSYKVRFLFVFTVKGTRQYIVSEEVNVKAKFKK